MPQIQVDVLATIGNQFSELVEQLKIANKLKAWELKYKHREFGPTQNNAIEIDAIMKGE